MQETNSQEVQQLPVLWLDGKRFCVDEQNHKVWNLDDPGECYDLEFLDIYGHKVVPDCLHGGDQ